MNLPTTIAQAVDALSSIIAECEERNDTAGYFAALYRRVTIRVQQGIQNNEFENGARMEQLDVIFANRYLHAYYNWRQNKPVSASWQKAFDISTDYWPIVLQHLLMGMNAHINLDLGVAAAEVSTGKNILDLQNDFNRINSILSSLVAQVQECLSKIWPRLKWILQHTGKADDFMADFSMQLSRDGAWRFAQTLAAANTENLASLIAARDAVVAEKSKIITHDGAWVSVILAIIRLGEGGSVKQKIETLIT